MPVVGLPRATSFLLFRYSVIPVTIRAGPPINAKQRSKIPLIVESSAEFRGELSRFRAVVMAPPLLCFPLQSMKTEVEFRSSKFPPYEGEQEQINPGLWGKRLAEYLQQKLRSEGVQTG